MTRHRFHWSGLFFGLLFIGIAASWAIWQGDFVTGREMSYGFSAVLIVAGLLGVLATFRKPRLSASVDQPVDQSEAPPAEQGNNEENLT